MKIVLSEKELCDVMNGNGLRDVILLSKGYKAMNVTPLTSMNKYEVNMEKKSDADTTDDSAD